MPYRLGIDTGGTFTDLALVDDFTGAVQLFKLSSTPADPSQAILGGIGAILHAHGVAPATVLYLGHGTTVATNAVLEREWASTALVTTRGFRDVLELARQRRPDLYDLDLDKPKPVIPRDLRLEVRERLQYDGTVLAALDEEQVRAIALSLRSRGVQAVAVCFLHSYLNPVHERRVREILQEENPGVAVSLSSEVLPEFREYERFSTTALNAALVPVMSGYLERLELLVRQASMPAGPRIMQSNGGVTGSTAAGVRPVNTLFSGPSAGVMGAVHVSSLSGLSDLITFDMGGTSTDVCLVDCGDPATATQRSISGFPVRGATLDVHSIGAGGGSIGWVDPGGFLRVGPRSAGALPGPACYGLGGSEPTVTDANVILGRLNPQYLLGGRMPIDATLSRAAMAGLGEKLGLTPTDVARGMVSIVNSNIIGAIRVISVEKGYDPRQFTLVAYGGAGPLHAAQLARELQMPAVLVPESPGVLCALGLLVADLRADFGRTVITSCGDPDLETVNRVRLDLESQAIEWLCRENVKPENRILQLWADLRYIGQDYELSVPAPAAHLDEPAITMLAKRFHAEHERNHGYSSPDAPAELVAIRVVARSLTPKPDFPKQPLVGTDPSAARVGTRQVFFEDSGAFTACPIYSRAALRPGNYVTGPAIIEQMDSTTTVLPGQMAAVDLYRNLLIREGSRRGVTDHA